MLEHNQKRLCHSIDIFLWTHAGKAVCRWPYWPWPRWIGLARSDSGTGNDGTSKDALTVSRVLRVILPGSGKFCVWELTSIPKCPHFGFTWPGRLLIAHPCPPCRLLPWLGRLSACSCFSLQFAAVVDSFWGASLSQSAGATGKCV